MYILIKDKEDLDFYSENTPWNTYYDAAYDKYNFEIGTSRYLISKNIFDELIKFGEGSNNCEKMIIDINNCTIDKI